MKNRLLVIFFFLLSCETYIEFDTENVPLHLAAHAFISPEDSFIVNLAVTKNIFDTTIYKYDASEICPVLYEDGKEKGKLINLGNNKYWLEEINVLEGQIFTFTVEGSSLGQISCTDTVPALVPVNIVNGTLQYGKSSNGSDYDRISIEFYDPVNEKNFYQVIIHFEYLENIFDYQLPFETDTIPSGNYYLFTYENVITNEGVFGNGGDLFPSLFFSDELINGLHCQIDFNCVRLINTEKKMRIIVFFRSISKNYYSYLKREQLYKNYLNTDVVFGPSEPVSLYSNVEGGYGIFAFYQQSTDSLIFYTQDGNGE